MLVRSVAPLSSAGSPEPSPTIICPSVSTDVAVIAPVPPPIRIPPSVSEVAPVPPRATASVPEEMFPALRLVRFAPERSSIMVELNGPSSLPSVPTSDTFPVPIFRPPPTSSADAPVPLTVSPVNVGLSPVPTPMLVRRVDPLSIDGAPDPSPTIICPSVSTAVAEIAPVPPPSNTPPSVSVVAPVPPRATASVPEETLSILRLFRLAPERSSMMVELNGPLILPSVPTSATLPVPIFSPPPTSSADAPVPLTGSPVNVGLSPVPTPMLVRRVAPLSATGSPDPSPTIICPSVRTARAVMAPVPLPSKTPPSVRLVAPVPPFATARVPVKLAAAR